MTRMWEVRAAPGRLEDLLAWVAEHAPAGASVFRGAEGPDWVVVIDPGGCDPGTAPGELAARPAHAWDFVPVHRPAG
jgi:hypothetical protein